MKKIILLFILFSYSCSWANKPQSISKNEFEKLIDYINWELTFTYIENFVKEENKDDFETIKERRKYNSIEDPLDSDELLNLLSENFKLTRDSVTYIINNRKDRYDRKLSTDALLNLAFDEKDIKRENFRRIEFKQNVLRQEVEVRYNLINENIQQTTMPVTQNAASNYESNGQGSGFSFWSYLFFAFAALLIIIISISVNQYFLEKELKSTLKKIKADNERTRNSLAFEARKSTHPDNPQAQVISSIKKMEERIQKLENEIKSTTIKDFNLAEGVKNSEDFISREHEPVKQNQTKTFFMGAPTSQGSFKNRNKTMFPSPGLTVYKFSMQSESFASFKFEADEIITRDALNSPYKFTDPVCIAENSPSPNSRKIITIEEGHVVLIDELWNVESKARIRYE